MPLHLISHYIGPHGGAWEVHWFPRNQTAENYAKEETRKAKSISTPVLKWPASNATIRANAKTRSTMKGKVQAKGTGKKAKSQ